MVDRSDRDECVVAVPGGDLAVQRFGEGHALVMIHGVAQNLCSWERFTSLLPPDFHVVSYDLRGHGRSARLEHDSFAIHARDLAILVEALHLERPIIVGFSLGAWVGLRFAAATPWLHGFVGVEGPLARHADAFDELGSPLPPIDDMREEFEAEHFAGSEQEVEALLESLGIVGSDMEAEARRSFAPVGGVLERRPTPEERIWHQRALRSEQPLEHFVRLQVPTILLVATDPWPDAVATDPWPDAPAALRAVRRRQLTKILDSNSLIRADWVDCGHDIVSERPAALVDAILHVDSSRR